MGWWANLIKSMQVPDIQILSHGSTVPRAVPPHRNCPECGSGDVKHDGLSHFAEIRAVTLYGRVCEKCGCHFVFSHKGAA